jgi:Flp pilus assembly protein TadG
MSAARRGQTGATLIEFAIVSPVLFSLFLGLICFSIVIGAQNSVANGVRDGARLGIINFNCADSYTGSPNAGHDSCGSGNNANYTAITKAVKATAGALATISTIGVRCVDGSNTNLTTKVCNSAITPGVDLIEVTVTWTALVGTPFIAGGSRTEFSRMMVFGLPTLSS